MKGVIKMKLFKKLLFSSICVITLVALGGCSPSQIENNQSVEETVVSENVNEVKSFKGQIIDFDELLNRDNEIESTAAVYNATYANDNERLMYVFASPVRQKGEQSMNKIPLNITSVEDDTYCVSNDRYQANFDNSCVYLDDSINKFYLHWGNLFNDAKKVSYDGIYNYSKEAIAYLGNQIEIYSYPCFSGIAFDFNFVEKPKTNVFEFKLDLENCSYENDPAGYIKFMDGDNIVAIFYLNILVDSENEINTNNEAKIIKKHGEKYLQIYIEKLLEGNISYPACVSANLDLYTDKMFFDSSVYQSKPHLNSLYNNVSFFDNENNNNEGYTYLKLNLDSITPATSSQLMSINYNFYVMATTGRVKLEAYLVPKGWCSYTINWGNKPDYTKKVGDLLIDSRGYYSLDITDFAKEYINNRQNYSVDCSILLKLGDSDKGSLVIASADNTVTPPFFAVNYNIKSR